MDENSTGVISHAAAARSWQVQRLLTELIESTCLNVAEAEEPRFQTLVETAVEVLGGLRSAFARYDQEREAAWKNLPQPSSH